MIDSFVLLTPILLLGVIALAGFVGCDVVFNLDRPPIDAPDAPENFQAMPGDAKVFLTWDPYDDATKFTVYRSTAHGTDKEDYPDKHDVEEGKVSYPDDPATNGVPYFYRLTATIGAQESELSDEESATPASGLESFVLPNGVTLGLPPRTDFTGAAGMAIRVGSADVLVQTLGRIVDPGHLGLHVVSIIDPTMMNQSNPSVTVDTSTVEIGKFVYAPLAIAVPLTAGGTYYVVSQESAGVPFYNVVGTTVETTNVASVLGGVYKDATTPFTMVPNPNHTYGPVDFQY